MAETEKKAHPVLLLLSQQVWGWMQPPWAAFISLGIPLVSPRGHPRALVTKGGGLGWHQLGVTVLVHSRTRQSSAWRVCPNSSCPPTLTHPGTEMKLCVLWISPFHQPWQPHVFIKWDESGIFAAQERGEYSK